MKEHRSSVLFSICSRPVLTRRLSFLLLISLAAPWQVFAADYIDTFQNARGTLRAQPFVEPNDVPNGAFNFSIPISVPPGRAGMEPSIKLSYDSSSGKQDGLLGYGWTLNIPSIERLNKNGVDRLYNQDIAHSFFSSSLSGEILYIATTTAVSGSFLSQVFSFLAHPLKLLSFHLAQLDKIDTSDAPYGSFNNASDTETATTEVSATDTAQDPILTPEATSSEDISTDTPKASAVADFFNELADKLTGVNTPTVYSAIPQMITEDSAPRDPGEKIIPKTSLDDLFRPDGSRSLEGIDPELSAKRSLNSKQYFGGFDKDGQIKMKTRFYAQNVHYFDEITGNLEDIDPKFTKTNDGWAMTHDSFQIFTHTDRTRSPVVIKYDGQLITIDTPNISSTSSPVRNGEVSGNNVTYPDHFGNNIDLSVTTENTNLLEEAVINDNSVLINVQGEYLEIPFLIRSNQPLTLTVGEKTLSTDTPLISSESAVITNANGKQILILPPKAVAQVPVTTSGTTSLAIDIATSSTDVVPADPNIIPIDIEYSATTSGIIMTKRIPVNFLQHALYPVRTDAIFDFYSDPGNAGTTSVDGNVNTQDRFPWSSAHDATNGDLLDRDGNLAVYAQATAHAGFFYVARGLMNFDTSSLGSGAGISSATLYLHGNGAVEDTNSCSASLVGNTGSANNQYTTSDFAQFGTTKYSTDIPASSWATTSWNTYALNAAGLAAINVSGITKFGFRNSLDMDNFTPSGSNAIGFQSVDTSGTTSDPYLEIDSLLGALSGTSLNVESQTNPGNIATSNPRFSAIVSSSSPTLMAVSYELQMSTSSTQWTTPYWDSGKQALSSSTPVNQRTPQIYSTTALSTTNGQTYYWRIRFWDQTDTVGVWSTTGDFFTMRYQGDYSAKVQNGDFIRYTYPASVYDGWTAYDKKGTRYSFGSASSSRIASSTNVFKWMLGSMTDPNGNTITYTYATDSNQMYPSKINYTSNGASAGTGEVDFVYENRSDIATSSAIGFTVTTKKRLKEVLVYTNGALTHRYQLGYGVGGNGLRSLLSSVTESAWNSMTGTTTLPATTFGYSTGASTWSQSPFWTAPVNFSVTGIDQGVRAMDVNGDGLTDIVHGNGGGGINTVYINNGNGWTASSSWSLPTYFVSSGSAPNDYALRIADINGDGLTDLIRSWVNTPTIDNKVYINNGTSTWVESAAWSGSIPCVFVQDTTTDMGCRLIDLNGDGLTDILSSKNGSYAAYVNNGSRWVQDNAWNFNYDFTSGTTDYGYRFLDVNGDGLTDIVQSTADGIGGEFYRTWFNNGHGWTEQTSPVINVSEPFVITSGADVGTRFIDVNSDGLTDIIRAETTGPQNTYINTGFGWATTTWTFPITGFVDAFYHGQDTGARTFEVNGDGEEDMVSGSSVYLKDGKKPDMLVRVNNSKGGNLSVAYQSTPTLVMGSSTLGTGVLLNPKLPFQFDVVTSIAADPGYSGTIATTTYSYAGGEYYGTVLNDRQFVGFASTTKSNTLGHTLRTYFHQGNSSDSANGEYNDSVAKIGKPYRIETVDATSSGANIFTRTINKWVRADYGDGRNFVKLVQSIMQTYDGDSSHRDTAASTTYNDTNGNVITQENWGEVSGNSNGTFTDLGTDNATTTFTYAASSTLSVMSLPSRVLVTDKTGTIKDTKFTYDSLSSGSVSKGNLTKEEHLKSGSSYASTTKTYDSYGNPLVFTDPLGNITTNVYDTYNLFPATTTNALSQSQTFIYDYATGKIATTTDVNSRTFATIYDGFGRPTLEKQPDLNTPTTLVTRATYAYSDSTSTPTSVLKKEYANSATTSDSYAYFDGLGRTIQTKKETEPNNGYIVNDTIYNNIGSLGSQSLPYFSGSSAYTSPTTTSYLYNTFTYDAAGRVLTQSDVLGTTYNSYNDWRLRVTDPLGNKKDAWKDAYGNLVNVVEYATGSPATTTYAWNRLGKMTKLTDASANVRNFTYDNLGRLLTSEDLHGASDTLYGTSSWTYDNANNVLSFLNPRNQTINYTYDAQNRVKTEDYTGTAGTEVSYSYDSGTNSIGHLTQVAFQNNATTTFAYNPLGMVMTEAKLIGSTWGTTTTSYLRNGAVDTVIYPDTAQVANMYDDAGFLDKVMSKEPSIATSSVVTSITYSPTGATNAIAFANGVISTSTYDQTKKYRLTNKYSKANTTLLQDLRYTYDTVGNITQIDDEASTSARKIANYTYDGLYRLLSASTTAVATSTATYLQSFTYDPLGNILTAPSGSYAYAGTGYANPDAVTQAGLAAYTYDQSGNVLTYGSSTNNWDYHNYLSQSQVVTSSSTSSGGSGTSTATPAFVQGALDSSGPGVVTFPSSVATGSLIVVGFTTCCQGAIPTNDITDNKSNTYTYLGQVRQGQDFGAIFYVANAKGGSNFTVTSTLGGTISIHEYSGVATSSPLDKWASAIGTSTKPNSGNVTTATGSELYFGLAFSMQDLDTWTAGSGYTLRETEIHNATTERHATEDAVITLASTTAARFSVPTNEVWLAMIATFKPLVTTGTTTSTSTSYATTTISYRYDQSGNRVSMTDPSSTGTTTRYWGSIYQDTPGAYKKTKNIYAGGQLVATLEKTGGGTMIPYYVLTDHQGGSTVVTNSSGVATETLDYYPYGGVRIDSKAAGVNQSRKFIGQPYDGDTTGLNYLNARYQNPTQGQFLSEDPLFLGTPPTALLGSPQGLNFYAYSSNNPINKSDPSGLYQLSGLVEKGDNKDSIAGVLNNAYAAQYGVYFTGDRLVEFNGGKQPVVGSYFSYSIDLGNKYAINGSGYSGGGGSYVGGETNSSAGSVGGGSTPNYYNNAANSVMLSNGGRQDITSSLMNTMRTNAKDSCAQNIVCFGIRVKTGGPWDIKDVSGGPYESKTHKEGFIFQGKWIPSDEPGNMHYGYVGSSGWWGSSAVLHGAAGIYQSLSPSRDQTVGLFQDNLGDPSQIDFGIQLYKADQ